MGYRGLEMSHQEKLTHLLYFDEFRAEANRFIAEEQRKYILISLNINNFKYINSVYGFEKGDELLCRVADFYCKQNEKCVLASRMHADRFVMIFLSDGQEEEALRERLGQMNRAFVETVENEYPIASIHMNVGACYIEGNEKSISEVLDKAEAARRLIVNNYKKDVCFVSKQLETELYLEKNMLPLFEQSLKDNRILVYLQPKVDIDTQEIVGAEALARMMDVNGELIPPNLFVPMLEKKGLVMELDYYVTHTVFQLIHSWLERGIKPIPISVNLSRLDFIQDEAWEKTLSELKRMNIPKEYIEFEVTETVFFEDLNFIINRIRSLQEFGYKVSMDDFGTGYSSLNTVGVLPIDIIKFDRGFVQNSISTHKGVEIMAGLVSIFDKIGLGVICEGVETKEEEEVIRSCGCRYVQGYLHGRPIPIKEFEEKYMNKNEEKYRVC